MTRSRPRTARASRRRRGAAALGAALVLGASPLTAGVASATSHLVEVPIDEFCADVPAEGPFDDVAETEPFREVIDCLWLAQVTSGSGDGSTYHPGGVVTRAQLATFVVNLMDRAVELELEPGGVVPLPAYEGESRFDDVPEENVHWLSIHRLFAAGLVAGGPGGVPPTDFKPDWPVTRGQLASILAGAIVHLADDTPVLDHSVYFADDDGGVHQQAIDILGQLGISIGDRFERFNPYLPLNRGHMAAFLVRSLAVLQLSEYISPPLFGDL